MASLGVVWCAGRARRPTRRGALPPLEGEKKMKDGGRRERERKERLFHPFSLLPFAIRRRPRARLRPAVFRLRRMTNPLELFAGGPGREGGRATYFLGVAFKRTPLSMFI